MKVRKRIPGLQDTSQRIFFQFVLLAVYTTTFNLIARQYIINPILSYEPEAKPVVDSLILSIPAVIFMFLYELAYFLEEWKKNIQQREALTREHIQSQFEALKKQLDPHFLFNSLNSLASLIDPANQPAQDYLERLSDVYRYVLDTRKKATNTVKDELEFLNSYIYLNKVRFRDNLQIKLDVGTDSLNKHIPALSLQLLVENAIKHNIISKEKPLQIQVFDEQDTLIVSNNKQIKNTLGPSNKIGLQNIQNRYDLLGGKRLIVSTDTRMFSVKLPLLKF
ncbi:MAG: histidine kinase [Bacteroidia bacterium]|nr:histidine kinase [Bacteroidia bacterium]